MLEELGVTKLRTPRSHTSRTESRMFGAGSLEHIVSRDLPRWSLLFFNIHRERLYAAEPLSSTHV